MKKAGDLLGAFFDEEQLKRAKGYNAVFSAWRAIAGERLAAHTKIVELEGSVVYVEADHPGWIQLVQINRERLLDGLRKRFPDFGISGIAVRLGNSRPGEGTDVLSRGSVHRMEDGGSAAVSDEAPVSEETFEEIEDEAFRESLRRLEAAVRKGKASG